MLRKILQTIDCQTLQEIILCKQTLNVGGMQMQDKLIDVMLHSPLDALKHIDMSIKLV